MQGSLTPDSLAHVMQGLSVSRKDGVLHLSKDGVSKRIYFKEGRIVFAGSDDEQERLGEVLIGAGKLKRSDLDLALKVMKETGESLAKTVGEMGFTSPADIAAHALERTVSIIRSVFAWSSGQFYFEERDVSISEDIALALSTTEMILEGIRSIEDPELVRRGLGDLRAVLRQPKDPLAPYEEGSLSSSVEWILYQANGVSTIEEIVGVSPMDEDKTLQSIYALVAAGILEIKPPVEEAAAVASESTKVIAGSGPSERSSASSASEPALPQGGPSSAIPQRVGRYEVQKILGRGAMGAVYLANDPAIDRVVAVKLIQTAVQLTPTELEKYRERFSREAKAAGKLLHPGIVAVFDVGHTQEETPFIVMEYVQGRPLQEILKTEKLELEDALRLSGHILDALAYAHRHGIVHRDIKPANIIVTADGQPKIMDFGIAHVMGSDFTQADEVLGSPNYMAPEQLSKGTIDQRTDLFAFGVMLYRMLTGTLPFKGDSFASIAKAILFEEPASPERVNPAVSSALGSVVLCCLAKDPEGRFANAQALKQALASPEATVGLTSDAELGPLPEFLASHTASGAPSGHVCSKTDLGRPQLSKEVSWNVTSLRRYGSKVAAKVRQKPRFWLATAAPVLLAAILILVFAFYGQEVSETPPPKQSQSAPTGSERADGRVSGPPLERAGDQEGRDDLEPSPFTLNEVKPSQDLQPGASNAEASPPDDKPSDVELFYQATLAFESGNLEVSKEKVEELLQRNPGFTGAPELLVKVNDQIRKRAERKEGIDEDLGKETSSGFPAGRSDAELFYEARIALERGDLEASKARLEALLQRNPSFSGASELLVEVNDELWKRTLPISIRAKHNHRIGSCTGTLRLAAWGISYYSEDHEWRWEFDEIRVMQKEGRRVLHVETYEKDVLGLGKPKNYKFGLSRSLSDEDWARYQRLAQQDRQ